jgi:hypothetical protein
VVATSLCRQSVLPVHRDVVFEGSQQEGTKSPSMRLSSFQGRLFQQVEKKALGQIFGVTLGKTFVTRKRIYGVPVEGAKVCQSFAMLRGVDIPGIEH